MEAYVCKIGEHKKWYNGNEKPNSTQAKATFILNVM